MIKSMWTPDLYISEDIGHSIPNLACRIVLALTGCAFNTLTVMYLLLAIMCTLSETTCVKSFCIF